jgi:2,3-diketo-5-methylthio-1-phosphopentane phosphatase
MIERAFKIFVDFDGTITTKDVGELMFLEFGNPVKANEIIQEWIDKKINAKVSWIRLCKTIDSLSQNDFENFIDSMTIDSSFKIFSAYCNSNSHQMSILSDGLDFYIKRILERENLSHINLYSNKLIFDGNGSITPIFPHTDSECERCANCKRNHIINNSSDVDYTVYIGDGWSDTCPAQFCDFIFAKHSLLRFCEMNRITFFPFNNFSDVINKLEQLKAKKRLKKSHQADLKRKEIYLQG